MKRIMCLLPFALLILLPLLPLSSQVILSPEKISISAWVTTDRQCVSDCVEEIEIMVNCEANSCLCRPDVVPTGESHLSDCVASDECDGIDISAATMRYSEYCSAYSAELQGLPASIPATTTTAASSASNTFLTDISTVADPFLTGPTQTGSSSFPTSSSNYSQSPSSSCKIGSLSCGGVAGIVIACLLPLVGVGGFTLYNKKFRNSNNNNKVFVNHGHVFLDGKGNEFMAG